MVLIFIVLQPADPVVLLYKVKHTDIENIQEVMHIHFQEFQHRNIPPIYKFRIYKQIIAFSIK